MNTTQIVKQLSKDNQALFIASQMQVEAYFNASPSTENLLEHFTGRMVNERMNMVAISKKVADMPADTDTAYLRTLSKQALDEANHFEMVKEVIEHIAGHKINVADAIAAEAARPTAKGADLLAKYNASADPIALALYQFIAEGRAEAVWNKMAECITDEFISKRYAKIAKDEGFHSKIGLRSLEKLLDTEQACKYASELADNIRKDLFIISQQNTVALPEAKKLMDDALLA